MQTFVALVFGIGLGVALGLAAGSSFVVGTYRLLTDKQGMACADGCMHLHWPGTQAGLDDGSLHFRAAIRRRVQRSTGSQRQAIVDAAKVAGPDWGGTNVN